MYPAPFLRGEEVKEPIKTIIQLTILIDSEPNKRYIGLVKYNWQQTD